MRLPSNLDADRDADGTYVVRSPEPVRNPVDWFAVVWVAVGIIGLAMPFIGVARWLMGW